MDLLQLEHFLAVVDEGSFTRAAERVYRTQSAISQSIKKLEDTVGAPLFARDSPELCLTPSGKLLADYARKMVRVRDEAMIGAPGHPLTARPRVTLADLSTEHFVLHHQCATTTQRILQLFQQHGAQCKIAAELWSFENVKQFVREEVGFAIVPRIVVRQELADGTLVQMPLPELDMPRPTRMIFRDKRYLSDAARALIEIVSHYDWETPPVARRVQPTPQSPNQSPRMAVVPVARSRA
jgi:DNA-binding transcriptional LysR family regulator